VAEIGMACTTVSFGPRFHPRSAPVTFWFIIAALVLNLVMFLGGEAVAPLLQALVYDPSTFPAQPWTLLTSPFVNPMSPFWFLLFGYILWWVGVDQERWWGSKVHARLMVVVSIATGLLLALSTHLLPGAGAAMPMVGAGAILCALFTAWCLRNPTATIILLIVPVSGRLLLVVELASLWWAYGPFHGIFAVLGSGGLSALYYYQGHRFHRWLNSRAKGQAKRRNDRRFARMMKRSGLRVVDDDEDTPARQR
jgi:hypothetical protein